MVAPYWLLPLAFALTVELCPGPARAWPLIGLAAVAWVLPQVHTLYYVFACLLLAPVLGVMIIARRARKQPRRELTWALLVLALGAPFMATTLWARAHRGVPAPTASAHPAPADPNHLPWPSDFYAKRLVSRDRGFLQLGGGMMMLDPRPHLQPGSQQLQLIVLLAAGVAFGRRRRQFAVIAGVAAMALALLYIPPVCTMLAKAAGAPWIVRRMIAVPAALHLALFPGALGLVLPAALSRPALQGVWLAASLVHAYVNGVDGDKRASRSEYLAAGFSGHDLYSGLHGAAMRRALCLRNIPREAVVATALDEIGVSSACSAYPLALPLTDPVHGVRDMTQRRVDARVLLDPKEDVGKRLAILRYYHIRYFWLRGGKSFGSLQKAYRPWIVKVDQYHGDRIITLDLKRGPKPSRVTQLPKPSLR
jgi:hypothetical protein